MIRSLIHTGLLSFINLHYHSASLCPMQTAASNPWQTNCHLHSVLSSNRMLKKCTGINHCWIIDNSVAIVDFLDKVNGRSSGRNITTYDFTTLYTKLSHSDILESMNIVIDLAFNISLFQYMRSLVTGRITPGLTLLSLMPLH